MNPTLDTDAIRKRFAEAIIGIRADGSMAVLVKSRDNTLFDVVTGRQYGTGFGIVPADDHFPTLIRPGDRCEVSEDTLDTWHPAVFHGVGVLTNGTCDMNPFCAEMDNDGGEVDNYPFIRPLPEPVAEAEKKPSAYGFCPVCGSPGKYRERRIDGNDHCMNGHVYPSKDALQEPMSIHIRLAAAERELSEARAALERATK